MEKGYYLTQQNGKKEGDYTDISLGFDWPLEAIYHHKLPVPANIPRPLVYCITCIQIAHLRYAKWAKLERKWSITE